MADVKIKFGEPKKRKIEPKKTYLVLYGSGYLAPGVGGHNAGGAFKLVAEGRNEVNKTQISDGNFVISFCPTDKDFFSIIKSNTDIKRLDVYSHAWVHGLNFGGFTGERTIDGTTYDGDTIDWIDDKSQDGGKDLRRVEIHENLYLTSTETTELSKLEASSFTTDCEIYFWGCNAGGQLTSSGLHVANNENPYIEDPKKTFAQEFSTTVGKGNVYALVGKGTGAGSMFKTDDKGENVYSDGEMLPANIALNHKNINTVILNATSYMKKFPL